jgi:uncharacterized protein YuzE
MSEPTYTYDEESDTLSLTFLPTEKATGIELTDHIILHINKSRRRVIRMTLLDYSLLVQQTEFGPRTFPLTGLTDKPEELRTLILELLQEQPIRDVLRIAAYTPNDGLTIPTILVHPVISTLETP